jgi:hypothetical protein
MSADSNVFRWVIRNFFSKTQLDAGSLDSRYYAESEFIATSAGAGDAGKPIKLDAGGQIDATMLNDADVDHGTIGGLTDDDHVGYARLVGRAGGQTLAGDTASAGALTLNSTAHATKGKVFIGSGIAFDETNKRLGLGTTAPNVALDLTSALTIGTQIWFGNTDTGGKTYAMISSASLNSGGAGKWQLVENVSGNRMTYDGVNDRLGLGTVNPSTMLEVTGTATLATAAITGTATIGTVTATNATVGGVAVVTTTASQTLTSKTLTSPTINTPTINSATMATAMSVTGTTSITGAVSESALSSDNIRLGVISGVPRIMLEDNGQTQWGIDNASGILRFLNPGALKATLDSSGNFTTTGAFIGATHYGSISASGTLTLNSTSHGTAGNVYLNTAGGKTIVGGTTGDHRFEVHDPSSDYRITMNINSSGINYINSYNSAAGVLTSAPMGLVASQTTFFGQDNIIIESAKTPASAAAAGTAGMIAWNTTHIYVCTAANTWKRVAIATW